MGWRGSARHWHRYETAYLLLAGLGDAAGSVRAHDRQFRLRSRHHSRLARDDLSAVLRRRRHLRRFRDGAVADDSAAKVLRPRRLSSRCVTMHNMAKVMLATGLIVGYGYIMEAFFGWYSGNKYERYMIWNRMHGPYALYYWALILCNIITPQFLWFKKLRSNLVGAVDPFIRRQHWHVARAVRDRRDEFASRLPAVVVGHVPADDVGLVDVYRHDRVLLYAAVPVHSLPADDFHL